MKIVFSSDDIQAYNYVREYVEGYQVGSPVGIREVHSSFDYTGIQVVSHRIYIDGAIANFLQVKHEHAFTRHLESDFPYLQMHFELTTQGCLYKPEDRCEPDTVITWGQHSLLFYPALNGWLTYQKTNHAASVEIELSLDFLRKLFNNDLEQLGQFGQAIEKAQAAVLGHKSYPITARMAQVLTDLRYCPYAGSLKKMFVEAKVIELLTLQISQIQLIETVGQPVLKQKDQDKLYEVKALLLARLDAPHSIEALAKLVGINRTKLQADFKQLFGTTIFGYITDQRLEGARELIVNNQHETIAEVAALTGYKNPQHFTAAFKKKFGYLPKQC